MFTLQQKRFKCFRQFEKMHLEKIVKQKGKTASTEDRSSHQRLFMKKMYLKISQNLQENICARTPFIKKETLAEVFSCAFCKLSKNTQEQSPEVFFEKRIS